ncbi:MAG TPA: DegT/DnrJ/EryC1/StrS family aminotransferase, partial [Pirellulaceae bacterium]|nr:DegT/DnrJ/EryC1/StrS family aminotransferase [Pirellulaceae bacterium]
RGNHAFPLSELQAAVLLPQLPKLAAANEVRRQRAEQLRAGTRHLPGLAPVESPSERGDTAYYKFAWLYDAAACGGRSRAQFLQAMQAEGVAVDAGFRGFASRSAARCRQVGELLHSRQAAERTVLLHHPVLLESRETIDRVVAAFTKVVTAFSH